MIWLLFAACGGAPAPEPPSAGPPQPPTLTVLAASSLTDALPKVGEGFDGAKLRYSFDGSSRLAAQVQAGVDADVVIFADEPSMDAISAMILPDSRVNLLGNTLVVAVPDDAGWAPATVTELADPRLKHLALAGENVPAGRYAREALGHAGILDALSPRIVSGDNVRTTLAWVTRGEADAGIVYATDVRAAPGARVAFTIDAASHPPIRYPAAALKTSTHGDAARAFLAFCQEDGAQAVFAEAGFSAPR
jgi:molybdate transport system substrate-binding protein